MAHESTEYSPSNLFNLSGLVAVVTGGGTGIGLMAAQGLAANGAKVYIISRRSNVLESAASSYNASRPANSAGSLVPLQGDISSKEDLARLSKELKEKERKLHILVNNSGVEGPVTLLSEDGKGMTAEEISKRHLDNESFENWDSVFRVNSHSIFFATMSFLPLLTAGNGSPRPDWVSTVINVTSISGHIKYSQNHYAYNASKAAANHLTSLMSHTLTMREPGSKLRLRINALSPGLFATEMTTQPSTSGEINWNGGLGPSGIPPERPGNGKDVAGTIVWMASSGYLWGQIITLDGGHLSGSPSTH